MHLGQLYELGQVCHHQRLMLRPETGHHGTVQLGIVQYSTIISYITLHYIIYYINHATSHQYSASCDPQDRVGPKALTSIDIHATSHHYTTKVPLALNTIVSHATSYT